VTLDPAQRAGVLTQGAFLATHALPAGTSPVQRGKVIRLQVMCQGVPPPPADVDTSLPAMAANSSTRAKYEAHATVPACKACHGMMDPLGFGLENFDGIGAYRTMEGKVPVDASGAISQVAGGDRPFNGPVELARALAATDEVPRCMATQAMRWLTGRTDEDGDRASVDGAYQAFAAAGMNLRDLMVAITRSPGFAYRLPATSEVLR
jgi:hypothetical protein